MAQLDAHQQADPSLIPASWLALLGCLMAQLFIHAHTFAYICWVIFIIGQGTLQHGKGIDWI